MTPCPNCGWPHHGYFIERIKCSRCETEFQLVGTSQQARLASTCIRPRSIPSQFFYTPTPIGIENLKQQGRECWAVLHGMTEPTPEKVRQWVATVPAINCGCRKFARDYIRDNPPPCEAIQAFRRWTFDFHCAVDRKTRDPLVSWEAACEQWGWTKESVSN